jgi:aspartyl-tRNA(Asn)/glutamyl-tRNA(Gln) amidotransferase subunit A
LPLPSYLDALRLRGVALREFCAQVLSKVDLLHAPVVSFQTPTIAETDLGAGPEAVAMLGKDDTADASGQPAWRAGGVSEPGFTKAGMPIGMQLLARPHDDATALRAGHAYQQATDWHKRAPAG